MVQSPAKGILMRRSAPFILIVFAVAGLPTAAGSQSATVPVERTGKQLYQAACQSCHAPNGTGMERSQVGFADAIPDFTDCSYASREAAQDWQTVVSKGGPSRRFSHRMPAFRGALTAAEIERVVDYVRSFCSDDEWPRGELNFPRPMATEKAFPEDEIVVTSSAVTRRGERMATTSFIYEKRIGARNQWELVVPLTTREQAPGADTRWTGVHVGDIAIAVKRAVIHNGSSILTLGAEAIFPTGDSKLGLGDGTLIIEPFILGATELPSNSYFQFHAGVGLPRNTAVLEREGFFRAALGTTIITGGRTFSPMAEVIAARPLAGGSPVEFDWIPQIQFSLSRRQHILGSVGVRLPTTDRALRPRAFVAYFIWDWFDGPLFGGW